MEETKLLRRILNCSKEYRFNGSVLTLIDYHTGERLNLDLSVLLDNEEVLEEMIEQAKENEY